MRPISPYGDAKLAIEVALERLGTTTGLPTFTGRIANLYGPGQNITKPQGLISQLCRAYLAREPLSIYVSLDTARDYIFAPDAGRMVVAGTSALGGSSPGTVVTKIIASQSATTVAVILGELQADHQALPQGGDGHLSVCAFPDARPPFPLGAVARAGPVRGTPLPVGVSATLASLSLDMRAARLADSRPGTG